ncbi:hypothetical protein MCOR27_000781 [Pyricularia oryzae]|nr:hypothetical protein MCOR19_003888 [Pyricularia oryzae]KAI6288693.1 hypothetical protein MCOR27_000781 [Pyricularia oryzae]KAI6333440.1 hypothetical protein MCOR29_001008 [Pyricularia oryzae]KAI6387396.1 hypothetical protein MCOR32_000545 [Pyricularia oryzae]KAI6402316.1 hypothetical protein MCOR23_003998 [Pyricularia oryzae]
MEPINDGKQVTQSEATQRKRIRKPRGRGLRIRTGCLTCRKRHKKCDERLPICGPCTTAARDCVFPPDAPGACATPTTVTKETRTSTPLHLPDHHETLPPIEDALRAHLPPGPTHQRAVSKHTVFGLPPPADGRSGSFSTRRPQSLGMSLGDTYAGTSNGYSPETVSSEPWTTDLASARWLSLVATDAANADSSFSLAPSTPPQTPPAPAAPQPTFYTEPGDPERRAWQLDRDFMLSGREAFLFRHFTDTMAGWLDLLDPTAPFSSRAVRLALRNTGVMKSILALAAKHISTSATATSSPPANGETTGSVQYYYETLHYVQEALAYKSYTHSEELLVTVLAISSYEMLDEADGRGNWQRHLKGVFWIQRSQNTDGECGGLREAVWWSWLRQDIWAAFREQRRCLTIWKPRLAVSELDQDQLARRTVFLLAQAVNCCAEPAGSGRGREVEALAREMDALRGHWGEHFRPLPTARGGGRDAVFAPLWVHPPRFGVAVQAFAFAQILLTLHAPMPPGFDGYLKVQRVLSDAVEIICGVAMEMTEPSCQIFSAQCLYGAGLCVQEQRRRDKILELMEICEARFGWAPMATWREDLRKEWAKADGGNVRGVGLPSLR